MLRCYVHHSELHTPLQKALFDAGHYWFGLRSGQARLTRFTDGVWIYAREDTSLIYARNYHVGLDEGSYLNQTSTQKSIFSTLKAIKRGEHMNVSS